MPGHHLPGGAEERRSRRGRGRRPGRIDPALANLDVAGIGRGCNQTAGSFTVDEIAYDANNVLRAFVVRFEQHCDGAAPALRRTFSFHAA